MEQEIQKTYKMKWFKFIIYVQLFFNAVVFIVQGIPYISGTVYGEMTEMVYTYYGQALRICDILFGVVNIVLAVVAIVVRRRLAKYKKNGPLCYLIYWGTQGVFSVAYTLATCAIIGVFPSTNIATMVGVIIGTILVLGFNYTYFDNRKELFVN